MLGCNLIVHQDMGAAQDRLEQTAIDQSEDSAATRGETAAVREAHAGMGTPAGEAMPMSHRDSAEAPAREAGGSLEAALGESGGAEPSGNPSAGAVHEEPLAGPETPSAALTQPPSSAHGAACPEKVSEADSEAEMGRDVAQGRMVMPPASHGVI